MKRETTYWKMKEAVTEQEAIVSIIDTIQHNPLFLNKCTSTNFAILKNFDTRGQKYFLSKLVWEQVRDLFIEIKTAYYNSLDYSTKF
jgi:hypothetical protein|tara:strand:+ start:2512 stop:2772 length:261 start_codon:yes stop_codon:yes gene_type:complete